MDFPQLKRTETEINILQAKLGLLRAQLKKTFNEVDYDDIMQEVTKVERDIDDMQRKYSNGKEVISGL